VFIRSCREVTSGEKLLNGYRVYFWGGEKVLSSEVLVIWHCDVPNAMEIIHFKTVDFMLCDFHLNDRYYICVNFIECVTALWLYEKGLLRKYTLKYLWVKVYVVCKLFSNSLGNKCYVCRWIIYVGGKASGIKCQS